MKDEEFMYNDYLSDDWTLFYFLVIATFAFAILYITTSRASLRLFSLTKSVQMLLYVTNTKYVSQYVGYEPASAYYLPLKYFGY